MRVALVSNGLRGDPSAGGAEHYVSDLADALAAENDVLVLANGRSGGSGSRGIELPGLGSLSRDASSLTKTVWHLRDQWIPAVHRQLGEALASFRPDVVHTHLPQGLSAAVFSAIGASRRAHVHTAHDLNLLCARVTMTRGGRFCGGRCLECAPQRQLRSRLVRSRLDMLIAPSEHYRRLHVRFGVVSASRTITIRHGAEGHGTLRTTEPGRLRIGFIGQLAPHKGVATLLSAFRSAPPGWRLAVAGHGALARDLRRAAGRDARISVLGWVDGSEKDSFYDSIDLVVVPSEWEEAATLVAAEAAVRGIPALVSDRGGLPETPEAHVFRARDPAALLAGLHWFAADGRLQAASARLLAAREQFQWRTHVSRVVAILRAAAEGRVAHEADDGDGRARRGSGSRA